MFYKVIKRIFDFICALIGIIGTSPLWIVGIIGILISDWGPVFYTARRIGKNNKPFKMYKFRSMCKNAENLQDDLMKYNEMDGPVFKIKGDPRITKVGKFIRKYSIDELPQLLNVLKGDMSLVGTRPPTVDETKLYDLHHYARLAIKPGITGMWQISGRSDITDFEEVVRLDKEYIERWNPGLDVKILLKTFGVVLKKQGSM